MRALSRYPALLCAYKYVTTDIRNQYCNIHEITTATGFQYQTVTHLLQQSLRINNEKGEARA